MHTTHRIDGVARRPVPARGRHAAARRRGAGRARRSRAALMAESRGRAWVNGREVGRADPRWAHLAGVYD
jgi:hypothetical protein